MSAYRRHANWFRSSQHCMPRNRRLLLDGHAYHVLNRGNDRRVIFKKDDDYRAFLNILAEAQQQFPMPVVGVCVMPTHWHMLIWPKQAAAISAYMHWVMNAHVHRYHRHYGLRGLGHLYQDRYKSFPIQDERHLYTVLRYIEANPLRATLVEQAEAWRWSSLTLRPRPESDGIFGETVLSVPAGWNEVVNASIPQPILEKLRHSASRQVPYGDDDWAAQVRGPVRKN